METVEKGEKIVASGVPKVFHDALIGGCYIGFGSLLSMAFASQSQGADPGTQKFVFDALTAGTMLLILLTGGSLYIANSNTAAVPADRATDATAAVDIVDAPASAAPLTLAEVEACQARWAEAIVSISAAHMAGNDFVGLAAAAAGELYGYGHGAVLFKPTKATDHPFRPTGAEAMSYFVGHGAVEDGYKEDGGFAINGGKGWSKVVFHNHQTQLHSELALAMGSYVFTCSTSGEDTRVEYTFGYKRCADGKVRICLHHSSVPYQASLSTPSSEVTPVVGRRQSSNSVTAKHMELQESSSESSVRQLCMG